LSALSLVETDYDQQQLLDQNYQQQDVRDVLSFSKFRILRQSQAPSQSARDAIKVGAQGVIHLWAPQAFGDGFHATTFMCLQMLEYLDEVPDFSCAPFLDVGTGSGVLSLVAYALWQSHCVALDIEQDSVDALQENWARNHYPDESLSVFCGGDLSHQILNDHQKFDMVCVNMVKEPLLSYVPQVSVRQSKGQALILSGYLEEQRAEILSIAAKYGYVPNLERQKSQDGWACDLLFKK
jgi:ribosomal protein L11 methyltransferase